MPSGLALAAAVLLMQQPVPRPFPVPGAPPAAPSQPAPPAPAAPLPAPRAPSPEAPPTEAMLGVPVFPGSQFLASFDAGRGQRYYLFGSTAQFADIVTYYRNVLKQRGELIFDAPATHEFDVGRFREESMAFQPGVTVKDFESAFSRGYPNPKRGAEPARFRSVIQIVPVTER